MKLETARAIVEAAGDDHDEDDGRELSLIEDYSGRGMYGRTTAAVTGDLMRIIAAVAQAAYDAAVDALPLSDERIDEIVRYATGKADKDEHLRS